MSPSMTTPLRPLRQERATRAAISCQGMRAASTASGWRGPIMWSMRDQKKYSVAKQANSTAKLPRINPYWNSHREFLTAAFTPQARFHAALGGSSGTNPTDVGRQNSVERSYGTPKSNEPIYFSGCLFNAIRIDTSLHYWIYFRLHCASFIVFFDASPFPSALQTWWPLPSTLEAASRALSPFTVT